MSRPILITDDHKAIPRPCLNGSDPRSLDLSSGLKWPEQAAWNTPQHLFDCILSESIGIRNPNKRISPPADYQPDTKRTRADPILAQQTSPRPASLQAGTPPQTRLATEQQEQQRAGGSEAGNPRIYKIIPSEVPSHGGVEVVCLGDHFDRTTEVLFGGRSALTTTFWNSKALVCLVPPCAAAGPVPVDLRVAGAGEGLPLVGGGLRGLLTYVDGPSCPAVGAGAGQKGGAAAAEGGLDAVHAGLVLQSPYAGGAGC